MTDEMIIELFGSRSENAIEVELVGHRNVYYGEYGIPHEMPM